MAAATAVDMDPKVLMVKMLVKMLVEVDVD